MVTERRILIKACGIRTIEGARACLDLDVDFAGLNFVPSSRRRISIESAKRLRAELDTVSAVGVFMGQDCDEITRIAEAVGLEWIQLHGNESPEQCAELARSFRVIKAFPVSKGFDPSVLSPYLEHVGYFLFDAPRAGGGARFDWRILAGLSLPRPFMMAGGLNPENVAGAIIQATPDGVDSASGIERDGLECPERIELFCHQVRRMI